jgi:anaerobic magnesium-protoporphyrin IX monomethyl ester cyclase
VSVLLTHGYYLAEDVKEQQIMKPYPPLGILYISAYLEQCNIDHDVFDTTFSTKAEFKEFTLQHKPAILGIYVNLMTKLNVLETIQFFKKELPETIIILGGPEVKHHAEKFLHHGADFIVFGEGEHSMKELCSISVINLQQKTGVEQINGIAFIGQDKLIKTPERDKIKNLDELPFPNRKKIDLNKYLKVWKDHHSKNTISVSTMRGCPYTCKWCSRAVYGLSYRRRSPEKVAEELEIIQNTYRPDSLWFVDDVFTISHNWLRSFSVELKKRNLIIPYECITRADRMNEEVVQLLKETGCYRVWIGAESGSQKVIDLMDRRVDVKQVRDMIRLSRKFGIESGTFIMLGYPGETEEDIEETIRHLKESNPDHFTITVAYPIKGTELYEEVEAIQTTQLTWEESNDRQIDFERTYPRRYYDYAVRRVINEVHSFKAMNESKPISAAKHKVKSLASKMSMQFIKMVG